MRRQEIRERLVRIIERADIKHQEYLNSLRPARRRSAWHDAAQRGGRAGVRSRRRRL